MYADLSWKRLRFYTRKTSSIQVQTQYICDSQLTFMVYIKLDNVFVSLREGDN